MKNLSTNFHQYSITNTDEGRQTIDDDKPQNNDERARCDWDFGLRTVVRSRASAATTASDALGVVELNSSGDLVGTGGIARKIRLYRLSNIVAGGDDGVAVLDHAASHEYYICTPAKLSSLRWRPGSGDRVICSGDYDGVVTEYDLERRIPIFERDEHGGRRVWSVDYAPWEGIAASGSDDGTVQMWDPRCDSGECVAAARPSGARMSSVCCVEFNPFGGPLLAVGCADRRAYGYDVRKFSDPVLVLDGHQKTVSYVRFLDRRTVVSAGTDGCLKMWDMDDPRARAVRTYKGHVNSRSFVGLSVWRNGGLLGCGSENNQVFVYDKRWGEPIWAHGFGPSDGPEIGPRHGPVFVSSVCWRQVGEDECTLLAGGSDGALQVFVGKRKTSSSSI